MAWAQVPQARELRELVEKLFEADGGGAPQEKGK